MFYVKPRRVLVAADVIKAFKFSKQAPLPNYKNKSLHKATCENNTQNTNTGKFDQLITTLTECLPNIDANKQSNAKLLCQCRCFAIEAEFFRGDGVVW
jgi:hypothetical protein